MKKGNILTEKNASQEDIKTFMQNMPKGLPTEYVNFICENHSATGDLPVNPFYFRLWSVAKVLKTNLDYQVNEYLPAYFGIGDEGGSELLAINLSDHKIYLIPFMPMNEDERVLCFESFTEFRNNMGFKIE